MSTSTSRLLRGLLEPCLLALMEAGPDYGLSLARRLTAAGMEEVPGGSLYPALTRLERRHLVTTSTRPSNSGPARKYYALTPAGRAELAERREEWRSFSTAYAAILRGTPPPPSSEQDGDPATGHRPRPPRRADGVARSERVGS